MKVLLLVLLALVLSGCVRGRGYKYSDPLLRITPNHYGLGVGSDQYGRAATIQPLGN